MSVMRHEKVDPVEWFAKVERLEADLCAMTKSRDDWQRRYMEGREGRRQLEGAVEALYDLVGNAGCMCDQPITPRPCAKCRAEAVLTSLHHLGGQ
jgi:hypothetical protein